MSGRELPEGCTPPTVTTPSALLLRYVARCGCGWVSKTCLNAAFANQAWEAHVGRREGGDA